MRRAIIVTMTTCSLACGHGGGDAGVDAAAIDAPTLDASRCPVDAGGGAYAAVGAAGTVVVHLTYLTPPPTIVVTDSAGVTQTPASTLDVQVTVHPPAAVSVGTTTIDDVVPGDQLWFTYTTVNDPIYVGVSAPGVSGATEYSFTDGEGWRQTTIGVGESPSTMMSCTAPCSGPHDVVGYARSSQSSSAFMWTAAPAQTLSAGAQITLGPWQAPVPFTVTIDDFPTAWPYNISVSRQEMSTADVPIQTGGYVGAGAVTTSEGDTTATITASTTDFGGTAMALRTQIASRDGHQSDLRIVPIASSYAFHAKTDFLPWISAIHYDACAHTVTWTESPGRAPDGVWLNFSWGPRDPETGVPYYSWKLVARDDNATVHVPPWIPDAAVWIELLDDPAADGYDQLRNLPMAEPANWSTSR